MSNNWFQFKKFIIRQDKTSMKVGTDGVLLGAWTSVAQCRRILDVGSGTGLVAMMLAQRTDALIDAVEIEADAAQQTAENAGESPWPDRIKVFHTSFQEFCSQTSTSYDLIVCNPPFFSNSLKAKNPSRNLARHSDELSLKELVSGAKSILNPNGHLCVILPAVAESEMILLSEKVNLFPSKILRIRPLPGKDYIRILIDFSSTQVEISECEMTIETNVRHQYSQDYMNLTKNYYLGV